jgi:hypothetical protein
LRRFLAFILLTPRQEEIAMSEKTSNAVAAMLGVSAATIRHARIRAGLPARKRGKGYTDAEIALLNEQLRLPRPIRRTSPLQPLALPEPLQTQLEAKLARIMGQMERIGDRLDVFHLTARIALIERVHQDFQAAIADIRKRVEYLEDPRKKELAEMLAFLDQVLLG